MTELISAPSEWTFRISLDASTLSSQLVASQHRLLSIKSYLDGTSRIYSGVSIKDEGLGGGWNGHITPKDLTTILGQKFRLTALDCFEERKMAFCAAAWVENKAGITWNWAYDVTAKALNTKLQKEEGKLISIRAYKTTLGGTLASPAIRYCAVWVKDDGTVECNWIPDAVEDSISDILDAESAQLISIDNLDNQSWLGDGEHFCAVWYKNVAGQAWFWNYGLNKTELPKEPPKFCSWGFDVSYCSKNHFVSVMEQFPKPDDPNLSNLMTMGGSADATLRNDLLQDITWNLTQQNLVSENLDLKSVFMFDLAEGGWSWWPVIHDPSGQTLLGLPLSLAAFQTYSSTWSGSVSYAMKVGAFILKAVSSGGKYQFLLSQAIIKQAGFAAPPTLPIKYPVFLGIQAPVEIIKLTNGKHWGTVAGQVINGTGRKLDITNVKIKLKDQNKVTVHKGYFTNKMRIEQDVLGQWLTQPLTGPVSDSDAPLPKFYDGFEVPRTFTKGMLKVQANVKFRDGDLECYGDGRTLAVELAAITVMDRLPVDVPVINGVSDPNYRWYWGNGLGGTTFNVHSYPEHRYYYDVGVRDITNNTFADPARLDENDNYYCWGQPVYSMSSGKVIFLANDFEDNYGNQPNQNSKGANMVVIRNDAGWYHLYVHLQQDTIIVVEGDPINPGDQLGVIGNSGGTTEPHLHVGISGRDSHGFIRSLPMTFQKVKNGIGNSVSGVLATDDFYG